MPLFTEGGNPFDLAGGCSLDGFAISCSEAAGMLNSRPAVLDESHFLTDPVTMKRRFIPPSFTPLAILGSVWSAEGRAWHDFRAFDNSQPEVPSGNGFGAQDHTRPGLPKVPGPEKLTLEDTNSDCSIKVGVIGQQALTLAKHADGPTMAYGFKFEVSGTVTSGRIGRVGDPEKASKDVEGDRPGGGEWIIGQWVYPHTVASFANGKPYPENLLNPNGQVSDDSPLPHSRTVGRRWFRWTDSPGFISFSDDPLGAGRFSANFHVYVRNREGSKKCEVGFHIEGIFADGRWSAQIGPLR